MTTYKQVYFRINTPSYYHKGGVGFPTPEDSAKFQRSTLDIFLAAGWQVEGKEVKPGSGRCNEVCKDKQKLYLHPQQISGIVDESQIKDIENILKGSDVFTLAKTDVYEEVFDLSDEEYLGVLESKREEIKKDLLVAFQTKRRNLFITSCGFAIDKVLAKHRVKRLDYSGVYTSGDIDYEFVNRLFQGLLESKKIVTATTRNGLGYRTA